MQFKKIKASFDNTLVRNKEFTMKLNSEPQNMYKPLYIFKNTFYITYLATAPWITNSFHMYKFPSDQDNLKENWGISLKVDFQLP